MPPPSRHIDTRKKILDQESKGIWPTSPPPGWVCEYFLSLVEFIHMIITTVDTNVIANHMCTDTYTTTGPKPEGCCADDIREAWESYAPYSHDGRVGALGFVGCPGGGDWCYASSGAARAGSALPGVSSNAKNVAAALDGLGGGGAGASAGMPQRSGVISGGVKKSYGIGSWKK